MKRGRVTISKDELAFLSQLVKALEEAYSKLELTYKNNDYENFQKLKKFIMEVQIRISAILR